jgi:preprotein translocase subunit YajC
MMTIIALAVLLGVIFIELVREQRAKQRKRSKAFETALRNAFDQRGV